MEYFLYILVIDNLFHTSIFLPCVYWKVYHISIQLCRDSDDPTEMSLFETLRETIYSEVATLISQNENRPHYLIELFRELQQLTTDYLRQRVLYDIKDVVAKYLVEETSVSAVSLLHCTRGRYYSKLVLFFAVISSTPSLTNWNDFYSCVLPVNCKYEAFWDLCFICFLITESSDIVDCLG